MAGTPISTIAYVSPNQASKAEPATPRRPEASPPASKRSSVRVISKAGVSSAEKIASSEASKSRRSSPTIQAIPGKAPTRKTDDRNSQSRDLTENLSASPRILFEQTKTITLRNSIDFSPSQCISTRRRSQFGRGRSGHT